MSLTNQQQKNIRTPNYQSSTRTPLHQANSYDSIETMPINSYTNQYALSTSGNAQSFNENEKIAQLYKVNKNFDYLTQLKRCADECAALFFENPEQKKISNEKNKFLTQEMCEICKILNLYAKNILFIILNGLFEDFIKFKLSNFWDLISTVCYIYTFIFLKRLFNFIRYCLFYSNLQGEKCMDTPCLCVLHHHILTAFLAIYTVMSTLLQLARREVYR